MAIQKEARPFQREVTRLIMEGKNVILQAPTGAGKTDGAIAPFIQNLESNGDKLPYTCLYATPMRVLTTQFYTKYRKRIKALDKKRRKKIAEPYDDLGLETVSIQTGEQQGDPQFESALTFCTIDQLLASFLGVPYSVDGRCANINVGAIVSSYLVLDEFHLYPLLRGDESCFGARTTTLSMLRLLQSTTRFILMTATFSTQLLEELKKLLSAEIVTVTDEDLKLIAAGRERTFEVSEVAMSAATVLAKHEKGMCSLVVCNTVFRAQKLYWEIREEAERRGSKVVLLHSRLTSLHRFSRSDEIIHWLCQAPEEDWTEDYGWREGKYYGRDIIVIATQVVEVGLDISVQTLHTELAPANSIIQRAGRCARFAKQHGTVIIYPLLDVENNEISSQPYHKQQCVDTWQTLQQKKVHNRILGFREEQELIDAVHTEDDKALLARYKSSLGHDHIVSKIFTSFNENKRGIASSLIRDIAQVHILIHDDPNNAITEEPWLWQSFALHPSSLAGRWQALQKKAAELDWVCKKAVAIFTEDAEADNKQKTTYTWQSLPASDNFEMIARELREALIVVLPSQLATYHEKLGFVLLDERLDIESTGYQSTKLEGKKKAPNCFVLKHRSYEEHIQGLVEAYNRNVRKNLYYVTYQLELQLKLPKGSIDQAIRLAIACHDLGKLGEQWQQWARDWQNLLFEAYGYPLPSELPSFFAKTDYDSCSKEQRRLRGMMKPARPPHHACESVAIGIGLLANSFYITAGEEKGEILLRAVCGAIAHHHTTDAHVYGSIRLIDGSLTTAAEALKSAHQQEKWTYDLSLLNLSNIEEGNLVPVNALSSDIYITVPRKGRLNELETWLYFVIVRALRLSDQRAEKYD